jgi:phosphoribosylformylglycinamidine synthase
MSDAASQAVTPEFRFAVNVLPKPGILDPQGRAVEQSLPHLDIHTVSAVRVGRRIELTVAAADEPSARAVVERLAAELLSNPLIETYAIEAVGATSSARSTMAGEAPTGQAPG